MGPFHHTVSGDGHEDKKSLHLLLGTFSILQISNNYQTEKRKSAAIILNSQHCKCGNLAAQ